MAHSVKQLQIGMMVGVDIRSRQINFQLMGQMGGLIGFMLADTHGTCRASGKPAPCIDLQFSTESVRNAQIGRHWFNQMRQ